MGIPTISRLAKLLTGLSAGLLLCACSMAGLPRFTPMKASPKPVAVAAATVAEAPYEPMAFASAPASGGNISDLISKYSAHYNVPESLVRRVVQRESGYNPRARNGAYYGLMQISHATARSMGYSGSPAGLLDADTNLKYAVKYLRGAYLVGNRNPDQAVRNYSRGYYYEAKRQGLLDAAGLR